MRTTRHTQPSQLSPKLGLLSINPEPNRASRIPSVDVLALGHLGKVRLERARVVRIRVHADFDVGAGGDAESGSAGFELVAADVVTGYVADEAVVLPVFRLADMRPGRVTVDAGESV